MTKQIAPDPFLDAAIKEVNVTLVGERGPTQGGVLYAKGVADDGKEVFVYPHRDDDLWHTHFIGKKDLQVKVSLGAVLANGVIRSRLVPFESQPPLVKAIVQEKLKELRGSMQRDDSPAPRAAKPRTSKANQPAKEIKVVDRDSVRRRAQRHAKDKGFLLRKDRDGSYCIQTAKTNHNCHTGLTLEAAVAILKFKLHPHERMEGASS